MMCKKSIKSETTHNGTLNTLVRFSQMTVDDEDFYATEKVAKEVFKTMAEVYNPSQKDIVIMQSKGIKSAITLKMRDPLGEYIPKNADTVIIEDKHFADKRWNIADIRPDLKDNRYLVILLDGGEGNG